MAGTSPAPGVVKVERRGPADVPTGIGVVMLAVCLAGFSQRLAGLAALRSGGNAGWTTYTPYSSIYASGPADLEPLLGALFLALSVCLTISGLGMIVGKRYGFWLALLAAPVLGPWGAGPAVMAAAVGAYAILRLNGHLGPTPA